VTPMRTFSGVVLLVLGITAGAAGGYWFARPHANTSIPIFAASNTASAVERKILYYRDPSGAPYWSATPKQEENGRVSREPGPLPGI
jgi:membrane fusion protein, copper/silver efflux system